MKLPHCPRCGAFISPWPYEDRDGNELIIYRECTWCGWYEELGRVREPRYPYPASAGWPRE